MLEGKTPSKQVFRKNECFNPMGEYLPELKRGRSNDLKAYDDSRDGRSAGMEELIAQFERKGGLSRNMSIERREDVSFSYPIPRPSIPVYRKNNEKILLEFQTNFCELNEKGVMVVLRPKASLYIVNGGQFDYYFKVVDQDLTLLYKRNIEKELNYHVDVERDAFKWVHVNQERDEVLVYGCCIPKVNLSSFKLVFAQCLFEAANKVFLPYHYFIYYHRNV